MRAFNNSLSTNRNPLSFSVNDIQGVWKLIKDVPGSFHINMTTREMTNRTGRRLQPNNLLTGSSDSQYIASTATYNPVSNTMLWTVVTNITIAINTASLIQGLTLDKKE